MQVKTNQAEAFQHDTRLSICDGNLRNRNLNNPPRLFLDIDGEDIGMCDTVLTITIKRPIDGKLARMNLLLSASHDGNKVIGIVQSIKPDKEIRKEQQAHFVWEWDDEKQSFK